MPLTTRRRDFIFRILRVGIGSPDRSICMCSPTGPEGSIQARDGITLKGAARAFIDPVSGNLQIGTAPFASAGSQRMSAGVSERWRSFANDRDLLGMSHTTYVGFGGNGVANRNRLLIGSATDSVSPDSIMAYALYGCEMVVVGNGVRKAAVSVFGPNQWTGGHNATGAAITPNLYIGEERFPLTYDIFNGNVRLICIEGRDDAPSGNPDPLDRLGWIWYDQVTERVWLRTKHNEDKELTNDEAKALEITASPSGSLDMTGYGHLDSKSASSTVTIGAFKAPTAGKAKRFTAHNNNGAGATLVLTHEDASKTAADRIYVEGGADLTIAYGETYLISYSPSRGRYVVSA